MSPLDEQDTIISTWPIGLNVPKSIHFVVKNVAKELEEKKNGKKLIHTYIHKTKAKKVKRGMRCIFQNSPPGSIKTFKSVLSSL